MSQFLQSVFKKGLEMQTNFFDHIKLRFHKCVVEYYESHSLYNTK